MVSFNDEKSKVPFYKSHINSITFSEKKSKKLTINITQSDGNVDTREYEGEKDDIQGLMAQLTQCQTLVCLYFLIIVYKNSRFAKKRGIGGFSSSTPQKYC